MSNTPRENLAGRKRVQADMPIELDAGDLDPVSAEIALPLKSAHPRPEDAWECARRLAAMLDRLSADAAAPEHYSLRVAQALAGSLADELEGVVDRSRRRLQEKKALHVVRLRDRSAGPSRVQRSHRSS
jgi:hypothetical protein